MVTINAQKNNQPTSKSVKGDPTEIGGARDIGTLSRVLQSRAVDQTEKIENALKGLLSEDYNQRINALYSLYDCGAEESIAAFAILTAERLSAEPQLLDARIKALVEGICNIDAVPFNYAREWYGSVLVALGKPALNVLHETILKDLKQSAIGWSPMYQLLSTIAQINSLSSFPSMLKVMNEYYSITESHYSMFKNDAAIRDEARRAAATIILSKSPEELAKFMQQNPVLIEPMVTLMLLFKDNRKEI